MSHLGERLGALVDGELGHDERDRVLAHLAACAECRAEADLLRRLKGRLRSLGTSAMPVDLIGRLHALGGPVAPDAPLRPRRMGPSPGPGVGYPPAAAQGRRPGDNRPGGRAGAAVARRRPQRARQLLAGAATLAVLGVGSASFAAGGDEGRPPRVAPSVQQFSIEHALTTGEVPRVGGAGVPAIGPSRAARP